MSLDDFERYPLLFGPSPVHRLERLGNTGGEGYFRLTAFGGREQTEEAVSRIRTRLRL